MTYLKTDTLQLLYGFSTAIHQLKSGVGVDKKDASLSHKL